jgi:hypothetical protein
MQTAASLHGILRGGGYHRPMQPARPTNGGVRAGYLCSLLSAILLIFLGLTTPPAVHHTIQHLTMAVYKRLDAAAAAMTAAKTSTLKPRTLMSLEQPFQRPLRPRRSSGSPKENDTNLHITTINLNRDRFKRSLSQQEHNPTRITNGPAG